MLTRDCRVRANARQLCSQCMLLTKKLPPPTQLNARNQVARKCALPACLRCMRDRLSIRRQNRRAKRLRLFVFPTSVASSMSCRCRTAGKMTSSAGSSSSALASSICLAVLLLLAAAAGPIATSAQATQFQQEILAAHNSARAEHGALPLIWSDALASSAASIAARCMLQVSSARHQMHGLSCCWVHVSACSSPSLSMLPAGAPFDPTLDAL